MTCLDPDALAALFTGELSDAERAAIDDHVDTCAECRQAIAAIARSRRADPDGATSITPPDRTGPTADGAARAFARDHVRLEPDDRVGRYVITGFLGAGAMGAVYAARDPQLARPVALKIVAADAGGARARRLVREAQAMARLSHPNVIPVYDAGDSDGLVFIAMKQVDGASLRAHLAAGPRRRGEILRLVREAGAGLAAAHAAGIVHRDLKPDNILVERGGVAQVGDFGLAAIRGELDTEPAPATAPTSGADWHTADGAILGTPAYMAPEVQRGTPADARSDQYSFAITLAEAITGAAPGPGAAAALPRRLRAIVGRATAADPAARFPTMDAMLRALAPPASLRIGAAVLAAVAIAAVAIAVWPRSAAQADVAAACDQAATTRLVAEWSPELARATGAHVAALAAPGAAAIAATTVGRIDGYASRWLAMRRDACAASRARGEQSPALFDLRIACLDHRLDELAVVRRSLAGLDAAHVDGAPRLADVLGDLGQCADAAGLLRRAPAADPTGKTRALLAELAAAKTDVMLGNHAEAERRATLVLGEATAAKLSAVEAQADLVHAMVLAAAGQPGVDDAFHAALAIGERLGDPAIRADALIGLLAYPAADPARTTEVELLDRMIRGVLSELPGDQRLRRAMLAANLANHSRVRGDLARSQELTEQAIAEFAAELGATHPYTIMARQNLAGLLARQEKYEAALAADDEILAASRAAYGDAHPLVVRSLLNHGTDLARVERWPEARASIEQGIALAEKVYGPDHPEVAGALRTLGFVLLETDAPAARPVFARAIAIVERIAPDHPDLAALVVGLGEADLAAGRTADAIAELERAFALWGDSKRDAHLVPSAKFALAQGLWQLGRERRRARALANQARDEFIANGGPWRVRADEVTAWLAAHR